MLALSRHVRNQAGPTVVFSFGEKTLTGLDGHLDLVAAGCWTVPGPFVSFTPFGQPSVPNSDQSASPKNRSTLPT
jgi:hypothetical protein